MESNEPEFAEVAFDLAADLFVARTLAEATLMSLPLDLQRQILATFGQARESTIAVLLAGAKRDASIAAMERAFAAETSRLQRLGLPVPQSPQG